MNKTIYAMAPLKFEEEIKEKLEQRAMKPSGESWKKLETKLGNQKSQITNSNHKRIYVAATIIGIAIMTSIFIKFYERKVASDIEIVYKDERVKINQENGKTDLQFIQERDSKKKKKGEVIKNTNRREIHLKKSQKMVSLTKQQSKILDKKEYEVKAKNKPVIVKAYHEKTNIDQPDKTNKSKETIQIDDAVIQEKVANVLTHFKELEDNNEEVTDEEINELLRKAQQEITAEQLFKNNKVSASALLLDVEATLDESFKKQVFEALKSGFYKLKTSLVERDN